MYGIGPDCSSRLYLGNEDNVSSLFSRESIEYPCTDSGWIAVGVCALRAMREKMSKKWGIERKPYWGQQIALVII